MKVLVLGSGAKDHAVAWWFFKSKLVKALYVAPGNPGTEGFAINLKDVNPVDKEQVYQACIQYGIDFVFVGTESPLEIGIIDYLNEKGISTFGAPSYALKLESDRRFSREFAARYKVPMPEYNIFDDEKSLTKFLKANKGVVFTIKPNSLSPSRIIINSSDSKTLIEHAKTMFKQGPVLLEQHISGLPITFAVFTDNNGYMALPTSSEYTKREHADESTVTGGMGAVCPVPIKEDIKKAVIKKIIEPTIKGMKKEKLYYKGIMTFSIVLNNNNPFLVDYHVRFNDPATQAFIPLIKNDIVPLMRAMQNNTLSETKLELSDKYTVAVVVASEGYPEQPKTGLKLKNIKGSMFNNAIQDKPMFFMGAVNRGNDGNLYTSGGRCITVVGVGDSIMEANAKAYKEIGNIDFKGAWFREDIGNKFFVQAD